LQPTTETVVKYVNNFGLNSKNSWYLARAFKCLKNHVFNWYLSTIEVFKQAE